MTIEDSLVAVDSQHAFSVKHVLASESSEI